MTTPTLDPSIAAEFKWGLVTNTMTHTSPLAATETQYELPGARWAATLSYKNRKGWDSRPLLGFLVDLGGPVGRFYFPVSAKFPRQGVGGGTPVVDGANQTGRTLAIRGASANVTGWLKKDDYFHFDGSTGQRQLVKLTADASTNSSGETILHFTPPIRVSPVDGATVEIDSPAAKMRVTDDNQAMMTYSPGDLANTSFQFVESFPW